MEQPYYAQIKFSIDVFKVLPDGSLDPLKLTNAELEALGITNTAIFGIEGATKQKCVDNIKKVLGGLSYEETR